METIVYNVYDNKPVGTFHSREAAIDWMTRRAQEWNYGVYRIWTTNGWTHYDVGPRVFKIKAKE